MQNMNLFNKKNDRNIFVVSLRHTFNIYFFGNIGFGRNKPALRGIIIVALSISSHEQTH